MKFSPWCARPALSRSAVRCGMGRPTCCNAVNPAGREVRVVVDARSRAHRPGDSVGADAQLRRAGSAAAAAALHAVRRPRSRRCLTAMARIRGLPAWRLIVDIEPYGRIAADGRAGPTPCRLRPAVRDRPSANTAAKPWRSAAVAATAAQIGRRRNPPRAPPLRPRNRNAPRAALQRHWRHQGCGSGRRRRLPPPQPVYEENE